MSDDPERLNLRRLPPVNPLLPAPPRYSQTILSHNDKCARAAYLYQRHHGGMPGHQLDRGSAFHLFAVKATRHLLTTGEVTFADASGSGVSHEARVLLEEVLDEHPELTLPLKELDDLRVMAHHFAESVIINPQFVVAMETKFVLHLDGHDVSGILDLAQIDGSAGKVDDYKTAWDLPSWSDYATTFQGKLYAVMLVHGHPIELVACPVCSGYGSGSTLKPRICSTCAGRGYIENELPPLGGHLDVVDVGEVYPRYLFENEGMPSRRLTLTRVAIEEIKIDITRQARQLANRFKTGLFPAVSGSHCQICPCEPECPLPANLRSWAGAIQTPEQAAEAAEWWWRWTRRLSSTRKELRNYAKANGPIRFGMDQRFEFQPVQSYSTKWDQLEGAVTQSAVYGAPFDINQHRKPSNSLNFVVKKLTPAELEAEKRDQS